MQITIHQLAAVALTAAAALPAQAAPRFSHARSQAAPQQHTPIWVPTEVLTYFPDEEAEHGSGTWILDSSDTITCDSKGNALMTVSKLADGTVVREIKTFDARGFYTSKTAQVLTGAEWTTTQSTTRKFDEITGVVVEQRAINYGTDGTQSPGNCFDRVITRDDKGRISRVEVRVLYGGDYVATERIEMTYAETAEGPVTILASALDVAGNWGDAGKYTDIVWENTDCQITSLDGLFQGANRISSAHFYQQDGNKEYYDYDVTATYNPEKPLDFKSQAFGLYQGMERTGRRIEHRSEDANGSSRTLTEYYSLKAESDETDYSEFYLDEVRYDAWDNELLNSQTFWSSEDPRHTIEYQQTASVAYDPTHGYPLSMTLSDLDLETGRKIPLLKVEFGNYVDASLIDDNEHDAITAPQAPAAAHAQWFDLSGRRVANPSRGIYIRRQGSVSTKVNI